MAAALFIIRLYGPDNTNWRPIPLSKVAGGVSWHLTRDEGYADATLPLHGKPSEFSGLAQRRRIEFLARESASAAWVRLYRGYVAKIDPKRGTPRQTIVTLRGVAWRAGKSIVRQRYAFPYPLDTAVVYGAIVAKWVNSKSVSS